MSFNGQFPAFDLRITIRFYPLLNSVLGSALKSAIQHGAIRNAEHDARALPFDRFRPVTFGWHRAEVLCEKMEALKPANPANTMTSRKTAAVPFDQQWSLEQRANELIQKLFEPILPIRKAEAKVNGFNYAVDVFTRWRGHYFYFGATYRDDSADERFDVYGTRLEYAGGRKFNLAYMRHTGKWCEVFAALSLDECLETIESMEVFWPVH